MRESLEVVAGVWMGADDWLNWDRDKEMVGSGEVPDTVWGWK